MKKSKLIITIEKILSFVERILQRKAERFVMTTFCSAGLCLLAPSFIFYAIAYVTAKGDLSNVKYEMDVCSYIGLFLIILGPIIHFFVFPVINHSFKNYIHICQSLNKLFSIYACSQFEMDMIHTYNNCLLFSCQIDKIEELYYTINDKSFSVKDDDLNNAVKSFGEKLQTFDSFCSLHMFPYSPNGDVRVPSEMAPSLNKKIYDDCRELIELYNNIHLKKIKLEEKSFYRFFVK